MRPGKAWVPAPLTPRRDVLVLRLANLAVATIDLGRAGLTCGATIQVDTDGPVTVSLAGCGRTVHAG